MKKIIRLMLFFSLLLVVVVGCSNNETNNTETAVTEENVVVDETTDVSEETEEDLKDTSLEKTQINLGIMTGPTGVGSVNLIENSKEGNSSFEINETIAGTPDVLVSSLASGDLDFAVLPANLASILYHNTEGKIKALATNNLGVVYIIDTNGEINSFEDLMGKTIVAAGKGTTPEVVFNNIAASYNIDPENDLVLDFKTEATEVAQALISGQAEIGLAPEPMVTNILMKSENARIAIDLNEEWKNINGSELITSVLIGRSESIEKINVDELLKEFEASIEKATQDPETTSELSDKYNIVPKEVVLNAIENMNLKYMDSQELKDNLSSYLTILNETNPQSIGGEVPSEDFFYLGQ